MIPFWSVKAELGEKQKSSFIVGLICTARIKCSLMFRVLKKASLGSIHTRHACMLVQKIYQVVPIFVIRWFYECLPPTWKFRKTVHRKENVTVNKKNVSVSELCGKELFSCVKLICTVLLKKKMRLLLRWTTLVMETITLQFYFKVGPYP